MRTVGIAGTTRPEGDLHGTESELGASLNDCFAIYATAVDEGAVGRGEIDEMPDGATTQECGVGAGHAVVGDADIILRAAADVDDRPLDRKSGSLEWAVAQHFDSGKSAPIGLGRRQLRQWRYDLESELVIS